MEVEREPTSSMVTCRTGKDEDEDVPLPGFRFHPTDEELVGFYLKRKVEKRPISIELIKQIDIYKFDPWDLPKASNVGDKEWYFFCKRGRKYRNSIRPNRVTGSGFWKATGIDRPIYSAGGEGRDCIGLKKSLVYYRGSAGKGTKTDWMMHEFRLPSDHEKTSNRHHVDAKSNISAQEAEVWTLCRIFKRNVPYRKCIPDWKELSGGSNKRTNAVESFSKTSGMESTQCNYISFSTGGGGAAAAPAFNINNISNRLIMNNNNSSNVDKKPLFHSHVDVANHQLRKSQLNSLVSQVPSSNMINAASSSSFPMSSDLTEFLKHGDWDELGSVLESGASHGLL